MAEHTPGPWAVDENVALGAYGIWTDYATHPGHDGAGYPSQICSFWAGPTQQIGDKPTRKANARLIAASPDLLAACKAALAYDTAIQGRAPESESWVEGDDLDKLYEDWIDAARAAIAKAEGRE